jgi:hypothetical protein
MIVSLSRAIDALLAHVPDHESILKSNIRQYTDWLKRFRELDLEVWTAACCCGVETKLTGVSSPYWPHLTYHGDTKLPVLEHTGALKPMLLPEWKAKLRALPAIAAAVAERTPLAKADGEPLAVTTQPGQHTLTGHAAGVSGTPIDEQPKPVWDGMKRELWYGGECLRKYSKRSRAANQTKLLDSFQRAEWSEVIVAPFPSTKQGRRRLRSTVVNLNAGLEPKGIIVFEADGSGVNVRWKHL